MVNWLSAGWPASIGAVSAYTSASISACGACCLSVASTGEVNSTSPWWRSLTTSTRGESGLRECDRGHRLTACNRPWGAMSALGCDYRLFSCSRRSRIFSGSSHFSILLMIGWISTRCVCNTPSVQQVAGCIGELAQPHAQQQAGQAHRRHSPHTDTGRPTLSAALMVLVIRPQHRAGWVGSYSDADDVVVAVHRQRELNQVVGAHREKV